LVARLRPRIANTTARVLGIAALALEHPTFVFEEPTL
jgi:hypothetical protein